MGDPIGPANISPLLLDLLAPREVQPPRRGWRMLGLIFLGISGARALRTV
jgi:hypothetical protein